MLLRFEIAAVGYHVALCAIGLALLGRARRRLAAGARPALTLAQLSFFAAAALVLGMLAALLVDDAIVSFGLLRFLAQALFGETIVFGAGLGWLHWRSGLRRVSAAFVGVAGLLFITYWEAYHREPNALEVTRHEVDLAPAGIGAHPLRIVHMTDLQADHIGPHEDAAIRAALAERPDLIVLTGDYIQPRLSATRKQATADLKRLLRERQVRAPLGVFAVRGDVDVDWPSVLDGTGITPLTGDVVRVPLPEGPMLSLVGLTIRMSRGQEDEAMLRLMQGVPAGDLRIVIGHNPNFVRTLAAQHVPVDLALAGHTHGGQVVLPFIGALITKMQLPSRYASGLASYEGIPLHVSRGIGMERGAAPQIRFLCPPEICVLNVRYGGDRQAAR
jgi:predicted MPP superfamily phosphohydrolase